MTRPAAASDSSALHALQCRLDEQSSWMFLELGERGSSADSLRARLTAQTAEGSFDVVAEDEGVEVEGLRRQAVLRDGSLVERVLHWRRRPTTRR